MSHPPEEPAQPSEPEPPCRPPRSRSRSGTEDESALIAVSPTMSDDELTDLLAGEPFAFLSLAAEAITHPQQQSVPQLLARLLALGSLESRAVARAIAWLSDHPAPASLTGPDRDLPRWLTNLDRGRFVQASYREELPEKTSYLLEVELVDGFTGTIQGRIDHRQGGALTNAWVTDQALSTIEGLIRSVTRRQPEVFRPIRAKTAADALAVAIERSEGAELPSPLVNRWPALRPLIEFALTTWSTA